MSEWKNLTLKQAGISLIDCDHKTPPPANKGLPYVAIPQLKDGCIDFSDARLISEEDFEIWTRKANPQVHDVVVSWRCSPGESAYVADGMRFALGQNLVLLRSDGELVIKPFLRWLIKSPAWWVEVSKFINVGAVFSSLKCGEIVNFTLPIPPLEEQRNITKTLSCLDRKIKNLRRQNETLERIAQTLFKHWFVDFEFPNEDGKPYKSSGGEMVRSELREIPVGWRIGKLGDEVETLGGGTPSTTTSEYWENGYIPWYSPTDLTKSQTLFSLVYEKKITKLGLEKSSAKLFPKYSLLLTIRATIGEIKINTHDACTNQDFITIIANETFSVYFLYGWLLTQINLIKQLASGSTFPELSKLTFRNFSSLMPDSLQLAQYDQVVQPIFQKIENNIRQIQTLTHTRDVLLPKLMSGKLRVETENTSLR